MVSPALALALSAVTVKVRTFDAANTDIGNMDNIITNVNKQEIIFFLMCLLLFMTFYFSFLCAYHNKDTFFTCWRIFP